MRFKYYLRGCGFGILVTAVILMIGFHRSGGMSDAEIMQRASELGMVTPGEPEGENGEDPPEDTGAAEPQDGNGQELPADGTQRDSDPEDASGPEDGADPDSEDASGRDSDPEDGSERDSEDGAGAEDASGREPEDGAKAEDSGNAGPRTVTVRVRRYEVCEELAEELVDLGLLQDAREFCLYMYDHGYDSMLHVGRFTFSYGMDMEEIAKILISDPE